MSDAQASRKQPYRRHTADVWDGHKDFIREHLVKQDKTYEDVIALLRDQHGFDISSRQLKRKADEWGFFKNIPRAEMAKMVRIREQREARLHKPTKFIRDVTGKEPQEIPAEKLDAYSMRFGVRDASVTSSTATPSCITYRTPTSYAPTPDGRATAHTPRSRSAVTERPDLCLEIAVNVCEYLGMDASELSPQATHDAVWGRTNDYLVKGDYLASIGGFRLDLKFGIYNFITARSMFAIEVLETAVYPGGPYSMVARTADILSRFVIREREKHRRACPYERKRLDIRFTLMQLHQMADFLVGILVRRELIREWEPLLGRENPNIKELYSNLERHRVIPTLYDPTQYSSGAEHDADDLQPRLPNLLVADVSNLLHIQEGPPDQLLTEFRSLNPAPGQELGGELQLLRHGRARALEGVYFSSLGNYIDAKLAFQDSEQFLEFENSVEIRLHRTLWNAEHRTRVGDDWVGVGELICRAHRAYMDNEHPSAFVLHHFPSRFEVLCAAASRRVPVDEIDQDRASPENPARGTPNAPRVSGEAEEEVSILSPRRLFPASPVGQSPAIDITAWQEFVDFSSPGEAPSHALDETMDWE